MVDVHLTQLTGDELAALNHRIGRDRRR
jgi:hypothetical protein